MVFCAETIWKLVECPLRLKSILEIYQLSIGPMNLYHRLLLVQTHSWLWRIFLGWRMFFAAEKWQKSEKKQFSREQTIHFSNFLGSCCLNSVPISSDWWNSKNWFYWYFAETFWFSIRMSFGEIFPVFFAVFRTSSRNFLFNWLYLWAQERSCYSFVVYSSASAWQFFFNKKGRNFSIAEKLAITNEKLSFQKAK